MVNSLKRLNWIQIVSLILIVVAFVLYCLNIKGGKEFFWIALSINMLGFLLFTNKWCREGKTGIKKADKSYSKNLTRKPSDFIFIILVAYYLVVCLINIIDIFYRGYKYDFGIILALFIIAFGCNIVSAYTVERTANEINLLLKGDRKNGSKRH